MQRVCVCETRVFINPAAEVSHSITDLLIKTRKTMADGFESDGLDDLPAGGGRSAARVVGEAARGWREAGGRGRGGREEREKQR